jgi:hypothetical protein
MGSRVSTLSKGGVVPCAPGEITVKLLVRDGSSAGLRIDPVDPDGRPIQSAHLRNPRPELLQAGALQGVLVARLRPAQAGQALPTGCQVQAMVTIDRGPDLDRDEILSPLTDASGLPYLDLIVLEPLQPDLWSVSCPEVEPAPASNEHDQIPPIPNRGTNQLPPGQAALTTSAMAAARGLAGEARVTAHLRRRTGIVLDQSASMIAPHRDGRLAAVLDVILGLDQVFGTLDPCQFWRATTEVARVGAGSQAARDGTDEAFELPGSGFSLGAVTSRCGSTSDPSRVFVITDDLPADLEAAAAGIADQDRTTHWVLVILARSRFDVLSVPYGTGLQLNDPTRDQLRSVDVLRAQPFSIVSIAADGDLADELAEPDTMRRLVSALVRDVVDLTGR